MPAGVGRPGDRRLRPDEWRVGAAERIHAEAGRAGRTSAIFARRVAGDGPAACEGGGEGDEWWV
jgi:hypothetical protein